MCRLLYRISKHLTNMINVNSVGALGNETKDSAVEGMSIVDVNMRHVDEAEANYRVREDIGKEDWYYTYRHQGRKEKL